MFSGVRTVALLPSLERDWTQTRIEKMRRAIAFSVLTVVLGVAHASTSIGDIGTGDDKAHRNQGKTGIPVV
jgi:hypothetical protein